MPQENHPKPSFAITTLGCKVNQYDSEAVREALLRAGCEERTPAERPDCVIINTCTVTAAADAKARRLIRRIARRLPKAKIVVTGCMVDRDERQFAGLPGVWKLVDNKHKPDIAQIIGIEAPDTQGHAGISDFAGHTRAFVKVQDGCDAWCAYCIVPAVRGAPTSRPMDDILAEVNRLAGRFREIVLTGIHVGLYRDASGSDLAALVRRVLDASSVERVRLSSIEPNEVTPDLLAVAAGSPRFCPHFHLPLQSGSDRVLGLMNRRYTAAEFLRSVDRIRDRLDRPSITTDVIVGFPGESDDDFAETIDVCRKAGFSRMHIFPYSDRPGTAAAEMPGKCPSHIIYAREKLLEALASELALEYKMQFVNSAVDVLVETSRDRSGKLCGYTDRYLRTLFDGPDGLANEIVPARIVRAEPDVLFGELEEKP